MQPEAILETVIYAADLEAAEAFYCGTMGLAVARRLPGHFLFLRCGPGMLLIFDPEQSAQPDPQNPIPRHGARGPGHLCFRAEDAAELDRWRAHLAAKGVAIEAEHDWPGGARSIYFRDPAGNSVEIGEARMWGPAVARALHRR